MLSDLPPPCGIGHDIIISLWGHLYMLDSLRGKAKPKINPGLIDLYA